jgi:hypothetical protein
VNNELKIMYKEAVLAWLSSFPGICMEILVKITENLGMDSRCAGEDSNWTPPGYKLEELPFGPNCAVLVLTYLPVAG